MPMGCLAPFDFLSDFYFVTFTPIGILVLIASVGAVRVAMDREPTERVWRQHVFAALLLSFIVLPALKS